MEHIYKYRALYGLMADNPKEQKALPTRMNVNEKGEYPVLSVLWTCQKLYQITTHLIDSFSTSSVEIFEEFKSSTLSLPTTIIKFPRRLLDGIKNGIRQDIESYSEFKARMIPLVYGLKQTATTRIDRATLFVIIMLSSTTLYLLWKTQTYMRYRRKEERDILDRVVLITGANSGIGERLAHAFSERGAIVIMASSNMQKTLDAAHNMRWNTAKVIPITYCIPQSGIHYDIPECVDFIFPTPYHYSSASEHSNRIQCIQMDLGNIKTIWQAAVQIMELYPQIDIIINNAGICVPNEMDCETFDGFEVNFGVNYIGNFIFTNMIISYMQNPLIRPCRIVNVTCQSAFEEGRITLEDINKLDANFWAPNPYACSKFCNYLFHIELTKRLKAAGMDKFHTYAVCPPDCDTNLRRYHKQSLFEKLVPGLPAQAGMQTILYCALSKDCETHTGLFYEYCDVSSAPFPCGCKDKDADYMCSKLWEITRDSILPLVEKIKVEHAPLERASAVGTTLFKYRTNVEEEEENYKPQLARALTTQFRNYYAPWHTCQLYIDHWKYQIKREGIMDLWRKIHGDPIEMQERVHGPSKTIFIPAKADITAHAIFDTTPLGVTDNYNWMFD